MTKLTSSQLEEIYGHLASGKPVAEIATMYKVSKTRIYQLRTKRRAKLQDNRPVIKRKVVIGQKQATLDFKVSAKPIELNSWNFCSIM